MLFRRERPSHCLLPSNCLLGKLLIFALARLPLNARQSARLRNVASILFGRFLHLTEIRFELFQLLYQGGRKDSFVNE